MGLSTLFDITLSGGRGGEDRPTHIVATDSVYILAPATISWSWSWSWTTPDAAVQVADMVHPGQEVSKWTCRYLRSVSCCCCASCSSLFLRASHLL